MFKNYIILCQYIKIRPDLPRERVLQREYSERTTNRDWLAVCHAHVDSTYVRTYDWMTKGGEEVRSAGKATGPFESSELTEASLVRHGSRSCSWLRARMCVCVYMCASRGALVRRWNAETGAPGLPPSPLPSIFFHRVQVSVSPWRVGISLAPLLCQRTRATLVCVRVYVYVYVPYIHARSWIVFSLASECNRVVEGEPLARVPVLVLCRSRGRILSRVVLAHTIFTCGWKLLCVCVRMYMKEGGKEGGGELILVFFFFGWIWGKGLLRVKVLSWRDNGMYVAGMIFPRFLEIGMIVGWWLSLVDMVLCYLKLILRF